MQNTHIANNIKILCKNKKIPINRLLEECSLSKSFIYDLEKRSTSPSCEKILAIANYLDCSVDFLLGRTVAPKHLYTNTQNNEFTEQELTVISAYKQNPHMQEAVNKLLGIQQQPMRAIKIARSNNSTVQEIYGDFSDLLNAPRLGDDDL